MFSFNRNKSSNIKDLEIEIAARKKENKVFVKYAKHSGKKLINMIEENGFTVTIALAMGAKQKGATKHGH